MIKHDKSLQKTDGFSLVEMAIVLAIVGALLGGLLPSLSGQVEQQHTNETRKLLDEIKDALLGYAITNGRLPCPASSSSNGVESFCTNSTGSCGTVLFVYQAHGRCSNPNDGLIPAATLGLPFVNSQGFAVDAWNNPIHYAVTQSNSKAFTKTNGMSTIGMSTLAPDLLVCSIASTDHTSCNANTTLASATPIVIYSTGKNGGICCAAGDEGDNPNPKSTNNDKIFVTHDFVQNGFDDIVTWLSPNILFNRMVAAGKLP